MRWHLVFAVTGFTRSHPQPSARFPWIDYQSRNRSPPLELSNAGRPGRIPRRDLRYPICASSPTVIGPAAGSGRGAGCRQRGGGDGPGAAGTGRRCGMQGRRRRERAAGAACRGGGGGNGPQVRHAGAEAAGTGRRCGMQGRRRRERAAGAACRGGANRKKPDGLPPRAGHRASTWRRKSPRGRWRWPKDGAHGGRPAGSGPVLNNRASPEMRPALLTATGPQPPKRHPSHLGRRQNEAGWLLLVTKKQVTMASRIRR